MGLFWWFWFFVEKEEVRGVIGCVWVIGDDGLFLGMCLGHFAADLEEKLGKPEEV
jgi:hypothetical protein